MVSRIRPLCERVPQHTDGKGTRQVWSRWWRLLAAADPCALGRLVQPRLLSSCNDPNSLLHGARSDLWRTWYRRADPLVAAALRLTLDTSLDETDVDAFRWLVASRDLTGDLRLSRLLVALLARVDERPFAYSDSDSDSDSEDLLDRDRERVNALNAIAERANAPRICPLPPPPPKADDPNAAVSHNPTPWYVPYLPDRVGPMFRPGAVGIAEAIRAWRARTYDERRPGWSVERFANCLGYRLLELLDGEQDREAEAALRLIPNARGFDDSSQLLKALAEGVRLFFVGGPISLSGGGEAGGNWIRQGVVRSGGGAGGRRYFCRQRPMGDFRWSSRAS